MIFRVIVTGSRDFTDRALLRQVLDDLLTEHGRLTLVHGACSSGADATADEWAAYQPHDRVRVERYPADWRGYGKAAGPRRNAHMVKLGADLCIGFLQPGAENKGTRGCLELADRARIPIRPYPPEEYHQEQPCLICLI